MQTCREHELEIIAPVANIKVKSLMSLESKWKKGGAPSHVSSFSICYSLSAME